MGTADLLDVDRARTAVDAAAHSARRQFDDARHVVSERAGSASQLVRSRMDGVDLDPQIRRARIGFWTAVRSVLGVLFALPAAVTRALGVLSGAADDAVDRGTELTARSRKVARSLPVTRAGRRRARARTVAWAVGGFALGAAAGAVGGYMAARRPEVSQGAWDTARSGTQRTRATASEVVERAREAAASVTASAQEALGRAGTGETDLGTSGDAPVSDATEAAERGAAT